MSSKRTVEVDEEVFGVVQREARPLVDSFNSVLRRKYGLDSGRSDDTAGEPRRARRNPVPAGSILPEREYELPLLAALVESGGSGPAAKITDRVGELLGDRLTPADHELHASGDVRWRNRTTFTRLRLKERGLIAANSPRGLWEITREGRAHLLRHSEDQAERPTPRVAVARSTDGRRASELASEPVAHPPA